MKKRYTILISIVLAVVIAGLGYLNWQTRNELRNQSAQIELQQKQSQQQIAIILLGQQIPNAKLEGISTVSEVMVAQVSISEGSSHLFAFIGGQWFDLGEGQMTTPSENQTEEK